MTSAYCLTVPEALRLQCVCDGILKTNNNKVNMFKMGNFVKVEQA